MVYNGEDGDDHTSGSGKSKIDDSMAHPEPPEVHELPELQLNSVQETGSRPVDSAKNDIPRTVTIPCHHIRIGDILVLQGCPSQVIRISTSSATGQYRYLGVDLFTKQLHEESSTIYSPAPSVVVQTMCGPILKQYRILDICDGKLVAMTENGDVKLDLPINDQFSLHARISDALESGRGNARVLVVTDGGRELAVDLKVLNGVTLAADQTNQKTLEQTFQAAVRDNDIPKVEDALQKGVDINWRDRDGRTALFDAIERQHRSMVDLLLQRGIDVGPSDKSGKTALDIAVSDSKLYLGVFTLLKKGAPPASNLENGIPQFLSAAAEGNIEKMRRLLADGVEPNSQDRLGYTALHEAACFGQYEIADMLIQHGAKVNAEITHGGATVLHAAVQRGREHRQFLDGGRGIIPRLNENHVRVVALLLQKGADTEHRRSYDSLTVQELVSNELKLPLNCQPTERRCLQRILILLIKPLPCEEEKIGTAALPRLPSLDEQATGLLNPFLVQIQYHTSSRICKVVSAPLWNFIYKDNGEECGRQQVQELERWAKSPEVDSSEPREHWKWAHLPANNKTWAEDLIRPLSSMDDTTFKEYWSGIRSFITETYQEIRGTALHARFRKPTFTPLFGSHRGIFSMVIPYFDSECLDCVLRDRRCSSQRCEDNFAKEEGLKALYYSSDDSPASFHAPCTLDQSYYLSLDELGDRARDQVVFKYVERQESLEWKRSAHRRRVNVPATTTAKPKKIIMVKQMWAWKIDATTLITAFPDRRHPGQQPDLSAEMSESLRAKPPSTLAAMISRILIHTVGFVDAPANAGLNENLFHIFEQSIAYRSQEEATGYLNFHKWQKELIDLSQQQVLDENTKTHKAKRMQIEDNICNITHEIEHLREIKDIKDELKMIQRVLEDQRIVIDQYRAGQKESDIVAVEDRGKHDREEMSPQEDEEDELAFMKKSLEFRISKVKFLSADASSVENSLNHLLDLKQRQGNLIVVRDTRSLANEADDRARASEWQNQLLFIFTIVTVVFTPISFISSILAVPTREFPREGGDVAWAWWQVFIAALVAEIITFLVVAVWLTPTGFMSLTAPFSKV